MAYSGLLHCMPLNLSFMKILLLSLFCTAAIACSGHPEERGVDSTQLSIPVDTPAQAAAIDTLTLTDSLLIFAKTLKGIPYKYASTNPNVGFDCSGFITYVYNHFNIEVPRTSVGFTDEGCRIPLPEAQPGDLILFTGTDSTKRIVGHMGIITQTGDSIVFIHSTSGKANGVTETRLDKYYMGRFMKVIRYENI